MKNRKRIDITGQDRRGSEQGSHGDGWNTTFSCCEGDAMWAQVERARELARCISLKRSQLDGDGRGWANVQCLQHLSKTREKGGRVEKRIEITDKIGRFGERSD